MENENPFPFRLEILAKRYATSGTINATRSARQKQFQSGGADKNDTKDEKRKRGARSANRARNEANMRIRNYATARDDLSNPEFDGGPRERVLTNPPTKFYPAADEKNILSS